MSLFTRFAPSLLVLSMLGAGAGCAQQVGADPVEATATTSSALTAEAQAQLGGPETFIVDIVASLVAGGIQKAIDGETIDYARIDETFQDDLASFADTQHVRQAQVDVVAALKTFQRIADANTTTLSQSEITVLYELVDNLNDDLASMRAGDAKKSGLRTYILAAITQHAVLKALMVGDKPYAAEHAKQLNLMLEDHLVYLQGRFDELAVREQARLVQISECRFERAQYDRVEYFEDAGAKDGTDPFIPKLDVDWVQGAITADAPAGTQAHVWEMYPNITPIDDALIARAAQGCNERRTAFVTAMTAKLQAANGFTDDAVVVQTVGTLDLWKHDLVAHGWPIPR